MSFGQRRRNGNITQNSGRISLLLTGWCLRLGSSGALCYSSCRLDTHSSFNTLQSGDLVQPAQSFCVDHQPCSSMPCPCHDDVNGHYGYVIDYPVEFQCAYPNGACTWQSTSEVSHRESDGSRTSAEASSSHSMPHYRTGTKSIALPKLPYASALAVSVDCTEV